MNPTEQALAAALHFVKNEAEFHLGDLTTEQSHELTRHLSETIQESVSEGLKLLLQVDRDILPVFRSAMNSSAMELMRSAMTQAVQSGGRVIFSSCGASGRLTIILESMWRRYWEGSTLENQVLSIMTGGERALIRSVENFEDYQSFGRQQAIEAAIDSRDVVIALTEGGEISSVIGTMKEAIERGAKVFMLYNNPTELLIRKFIRSKEVLTDDRIVKMELVTGPMALSGSTRMQATTIGLLVAGTAMDQVFAKLDGTPVKDGSWYADHFENLLKQLLNPIALTQLAKWVKLEANLYTGGGRMTYLADEYLLDIFSDTTERTPTFMIPPFRPANDESSPVPWMIAKNPDLPSEEAWIAMLRRKPRGLDWDAELYKKMGASEAIVTNPPALSAKEILRYDIGNGISEAHSRPNDVILRIITESPSNSSERDLPPDAKSAHRTIYIGAPKAPDPDAITIPLDFEKTGVNLFEHLAMKLIFNTLSTGTMARLGRIKGNWMIQVDATNKKLIDRATRIVSHFSGLPYEQACIELHQTMFSPETDRSNFQTSYVLQTLRRIEKNQTYKKDDE